MYKVETEITFPHENEIYEVTKDGVWYASFASKEDADNYALLKNMFIGLDEQIDKSNKSNSPRNVEKQK